MKISLSDLNEKNLKIRFVEFSKIRVEIEWWIPQKKKPV